MLFVSPVNDDAMSSTHPQSHPQSPQPNCSSDVPVTVRRYSAADESNASVSPEAIDRRCTTESPSSTPTNEHEQLTSGLLHVTAATLNDGKTILGTAITDDLSTEGQHLANYVYVDDDSRVILQQIANGELVLPPGYQLVTLDGSTVLEYDQNLATAVDVIDNQDLL